MAPNIRKYFIYTIFLVSPISLSLFAQTSIDRALSVASNVENLVSENHNSTTVLESVNYLSNSKQLIVGLSIPKGSFTIQAVRTKNLNPTVGTVESLNSIVAYSALAKDIIENYKYDFSETFIDILFFEDIDLARIRTI
jgi:hypothetical protein